MECRHETLAAGERCPVCGRGRLYRVEPGIEVRLDGHALLSAVRYALEKLRCSTCGQGFTAASPPEAGAEKYSARAWAVLVLGRYYLGVPRYRLEGYQASAMGRCCSYVWIRSRVPSGRWSSSSVAAGGVGRTEVTATSTRGKKRVFKMSILRTFGNDHFAVLLFVVSETPEFLQAVSQAVNPSVSAPATHQSHWHRSGWEWRPF
jgi:hypothetical protein